MCKLFCTFVAFLRKIMEIMKRYFTFLCALWLSLGLSAQLLNPSYLRYIEAWKGVAVQNQKDYGVPASIIMAQALLESSAGMSELAVNAKNHFGIKCSGNWMGAVYYYDDDSKGECFRQYGDPAESFKDHSLFLQKPRYESCFEIAVQDYEGWAYRLKECGYATDPLYAKKLIRLIWDYRLDTLTTTTAVAPATVAAVVAQPEEQTPKKRPLKASVVRQADPIMTIKADLEPPYVAPPTAKEERDSFLLSHPKKKYNGVSYVLAREGDTYANVAFRLNVRERELREDNDALGRELQVGERIYLAPKKTTGVADKPFVWTAVGMSLWQLSQDECVTIEAIQKLNELDPQIRIFSFRQKIYLRKVKEDGPK